MNRPTSDPVPSPYITPGVIGVIIFTAIYLLVALVAAFFLQNREFIFYICVMIVMIVFVSFVHFRIRLTTATLWCLTVWGAAHMAGGLVSVPESWPRDGESAVLYNLWVIPRLLKYDQVVHAFGFGITTWICWQGLQYVFRLHELDIRPTLGLLTLCVAAGMGFGAANEVVEFMATLLIPDTNVGGYENTGWDLVANGVGSVLAALIIRMARASNRSG